MDTENTSKQGFSDPTKIKFDEYYKRLTEEFQRVMKDSSTAILIVSDKDAQKTLILPHGHHYDVAVLLNKVLSQYKSAMQQDFL